VGGAHGISYDFDDTDAARFGVSGHPGRPVIGARRYSSSGEKVHGEIASMLEVEAAPHPLGLRAQQICRRITSPYFCWSIQRVLELNSLDASDT